MVKPFWLPHTKIIPFDNIFGQDRKRKANKEGRDFSTNSNSINDKKPKVVLMPLLRDLIKKINI